MAASATPTIYDPKVGAVGALSTTLTTTLYTAPSSEAGVKIMAIIVTNTGAATRAITVDHKPSGTGRKLVSAMSLPPDGVGVDIIGLLGLKNGYFIDQADLIRGGQDSGTDVDFLISVIEMKD